MAESRSKDVPLLPLYNHDSPPPYTPPLTPNISATSSPSKIGLQVSDGNNHNRRKAIICIALAVFLFIVVPLTIFGIVVSQASKADSSTTVCTPRPGQFVGGVFIDGISCDGLNQKFD